MAPAGTNRSAVSPGRWEPSTWPPPLAAAVDRHALGGRGLAMAYLERCWREATDGRKHRTGVALFTADGERCAVGRAVWIELARPLGA